MENPTYDEGFAVDYLNAERLFQNPIYSDIGHGSPSNTNPQTQNMYEGLL